MAIHTVGELRRFLVPYVDDCQIEKLQLWYNIGSDGCGYLCAAESAQSNAQQPQPDHAATNSAANPNFECW